MFPIKNIDQNAVQRANDLYEDAESSEEENKNNNLN